MEGGGGAATVLVWSGHCLGKFVVCRSFEVQQQLIWNERTDTVDERSSPPFSADSRPSEKVVPEGSHKGGKSGHFCREFPLRHSAGPWLGPGSDKYKGKCSRPTSLTPSSAKSKARVISETGERIPNDEVLLPLVWGNQPFTTPAATFLAVK